MRPVVYCKNMPAKRKILLLAAALFLLICNLAGSYETLSAIALKRQEKPYTFLGDEFKNISDILKDTPTAGYYTDKILDPYHEAKFIQAQYTLAPVLLGFNSLEHPFVIFDFSETSSAIKKVQELGMIPLRQSSSGIILAQNPQYARP